MSKSSRFSDASSRVYDAGGGGDYSDQYDSNQPLIVERHPIAPLAQGVEEWSPEDNRKLCNSVDMEHYPYDYRVYALTLVSPYPNYSGIVQHVMAENAEQFSIKTGQLAPVAVDNSANLPYNTPLNSIYGAMGPGDTGVIQ